MIEHVTFGLAFAAYVMLSLQVVLHLRGQGPRWLSGMLAGVALTHVALVWHHSFNWTASVAWSRSPAAFVIFHTALLLIVAAASARPRWTKRLLWLAWPIVSAGALGAVWRREVVAHYFWPVVVVGILTLAGVFRFWRRVHRSSFGGLTRRRTP